MVYWWSILVSVILPVISSQPDDVEVTLSGLGVLKGTTGQARNGDTYYQFLGVPYAQPPTGRTEYDVKPEWTLSLFGF